MAKRKGKASWIPLAFLLFPLVLALLQWTIGERNALVYITMSLPPILWTLPNIFLTVGFLVKRRWIWSGLNLLVVGFGVFALQGFVIGRSIAADLPRLRVMTFNVEKFTRYKPLEVAAAILREKPDVVCLQEAAPLAPPNKIPAAFVKALVGYKIIQSKETAIATRLPIGFEMLFPLRGGEGGRPAQLLTVWFHGRPVKIINIHLQFFPWDHVNQLFSASDNFEKEVSTLEDLVKDPSLPTIVAGDTNTLPQGIAHRMLRKYLVDTFSSCGSGFGWTLPAERPLRRLDYIYAGVGLKPVRSWVPSSVASDHRPVVSDLVVAQ